MEFSNSKENNLKKFNKMEAKFVAKFVYVVKRQMKIL
jgi:hypothetical protein